MDRNAPDSPPTQPWRRSLYQVIWQSDTAAGRLRRHAGALRVPRSCAACGSSGYGPEANFCQQCGAALPAFAEPVAQQ